MIRVQSFDSDNLIPILAGLLSEETTADSYIYVNTLLKLLPPEEAIQETYLILATLEQYYMIFSRSNLTPSLNKMSIMSAIENNIYEELKENRRAGFKEYAQTVCQVELDLFNEEVIGNVANTLLAEVESIIDQAIDLGYTLNQSVSEILNFQTNYKHALMREAGRLMEMLSNNDMMQVGLHFWGWKYFLNRHRIYSSNDAGTLLNLLADFIRTKDKWSTLKDSPLTSIDDVIELQNTYIESMVPIMTTPFEAFNSTIKFNRSEITVLVASKGAGKTTFASMIAGIAEAQDLKVMFYSPETAKHTLFFGNVLLAYIRAKYGFTVTVNQALGLEEPFEAGSEYSAEEKKVLINIAKEELASSGRFFHVNEYYMYDTLESDMRAHVKSFNPDLIIIDHTQEIRGDRTQNEKTSKLSTVVKSIAKDYGPHCLVLSHPGARFKDAIPTLENPISRDSRIAAWSQDVETLADNIIGALKVGDNEFKMFYTKIRHGIIPPMFQVFRMIKPQCWFEFRKEDQYTQTVDSEYAIQALIDGKPLLIEETEDNGIEEEW